MFKNNLRLLIEFIVIISGVLLSFYIDDFRQLQNQKLEKDILIGELVITAKEDLKQIQNLKRDLMKVQGNIQIFLEDTSDNRKDMADKQIAINYLFISEKMSVSFFPQDGIFNQLIANGTFNLIENEELKSLLLNMYTHKKERNYATSTEIDNFNLLWRRQIMGNFRIQFNYNSYDGEIYGQQELTRFRFNRQYYLSNELYGALSQSRIYVGMYTRFLNDQKNEYQTALALSKTEIGKD